MNYCPIDLHSKEHTINLIKWLIQEVLHSGGDGDGIWYSKYFDVKDIIKLIEEEKLLPKFWEIKVGEKDASVGQDQEWLFITNEKEVFDRRPSWQQVAICY